MFDLSAIDSFTREKTFVFSSNLAVVTVPTAYFLWMLTEFCHDTASLRASWLVVTFGIALSAASSSASFFFSSSVFFSAFFGFF